MAVKTVGIVLLLVVEMLGFISSTETSDIHSNVTTSLNTDSLPRNTPNSPPQVTHIPPSSTPDLPELVASMTFQDDSVSDSSGNNISSSNSSSPQVSLLAFLMLASKYQTYRIGYALNTYMLPLVVVVGIVGNILSLLVMLQRENRRLSPGILMAALAINDTLMLGGMGGYMWLYHEIIKRPLPNVECKAGVYFFSVFSINGVLLITIMTFERFVAVCFPLKARRLASRRRTFSAIALTAIFSSVFSVPQWVYSRTLSNNLCQAFVRNDLFSNIYVWLYLSLNSFLPFTAILIMNTFIVAAVRKSSLFRRSSLSGAPPTKTTSAFSTKQLSSESMSDVTSTTLTASPSNVEIATVDVSVKCDHQGKYPVSPQMAAYIPSEEKAPTAATATPTTTKRTGADKAARERQMTAMMLLVSFALLVLTLPQCVRYVLSTVYDFSSSPQTFATFVLFYNSTNKIFFINNAINFFLYCISGTKFRSDLSRLFIARKAPC